MRAIWAVLLPALLLEPQAIGETHLVVVSGLSGEPKYAEAFYEWATTFMQAANDRWGVPESNTVYLAEKTERDPRRIDWRVGPARMTGSSSC
jgi:hypothetical protein